MEKHVIVRKGEISEMLASPSNPGKKMFPPFGGFEGQKSAFRLLEDTTVSNSPEIHETEGDLWLCLQGEVQFTCGGTLTEPQEVAPNEISGRAIEGSETMTLHEGDWLWIPPGVAHMHAAEKTTRLIIIKIPGLTKS
ncbi:MAG: hypothetical protein UY70_C0006G0038 [Candidatus Kaiserbacteria bacterium GW2011_GWB1_52_6]|uniref:Cupin 2 conserved barrel domain-containing protein n=2 Tax=Candidatus Kaiseribacteriota TaxID=1752734 RepID=A0A0G1ZTD5_9BACT|nr:MAG: hypothetical protein UY70_C0006G0038 [Candidatus Kaiserbacteria bacterium GW2011_GWB1_52_6]KKW31577.1 MAG: hypothetical protein UY74_C0011G0020 [Candidatus Kaiserbacteria bacterium GW2011_GWC2_52_8b]